MKSFLSVIATALISTSVDAISVCPGEGNRYGDFKCDHDPTHRVCAQLLEPETSTPLAWDNGKDFWQITGQVAY